jgi:hypothetical protein
MIEIGHALQKPRLRGRAKTQRGIYKNGAHRGRIASPVQQHLLSRIIFSTANSKVPDRRKMGWPKPPNANDERLPELFSTFVILAAADFNKGRGFALRNAAVMHPLDSKRHSTNSTSIGR